MIIARRFNAEFEPAVEQVLNGTAEHGTAHERLTLGEAVSELILQAIRQTQPEEEAAAVFRSPGGLYTAEQVEAALDDE